MDVKKRKRFKIGLVCIVLLVVAFAVVSLLFIKSLKNFDVPSVSIQKEVGFPELNAKLFLNAKAWGISGSHEEIVLSSTLIQEGKSYSKENCFVFYSSKVYYKKQGIDTLLIYAPECEMEKEPVSFNSKIKVVRIGLSNNNEILDFDKNYTKYGLSKISAKD